MTRAIIDSQNTGHQHPQSSTPRLTITIDGPAGVGKSTVARLLASRLGYLYLDTGALYRALAWKVRAAGVDPGDQAGVAELLEITTITLEPALGYTRVVVDGKDVAEEIRTSEISQIASVVSAYPEVRAWLLPIQRRIGRSGGMVAEGRDLGTKVFPSADVKFFLDADEHIRVARRHQEVRASGRPVDVEQTRQEIQGRDTRDRTRVQSPLLVPPGAHVIDTSQLEVDAVVARMLAVIAAKR